MKPIDNIDWDLEEPLDGHELRFLNKLEKSKEKKPKFWQAKNLSKYASWAAVLVISTCFGIYYYNQNNTKTDQSLSPQNYYANQIQISINDLKDLETPLTKNIIEDAIIEISLLEKDYVNLENERILKGLNEQLLNAMIVNMQTRLDFLQRVQKQILQLNDFNTSKNNYENNI